MATAACQTVEETPEESWGLSQTSQSGWGGCRTPGLDQSGPAGVLGKERMTGLLEQGEKSPLPCGSIMHI